MDIAALLADKSQKAKEKTDVLSSWLLGETLSAGALIEFAEPAKEPLKAICIEALEFATRQRPGIADAAVFAFVTRSLGAKAPRVKWESAKVIGNTAHLFPGMLDMAIVRLLENATHEGTVVRWSAAFALGEILKLRSGHNADLLPAIESICAGEEKNSIRKIYQDAIRKSQ